MQNRVPTIRQYRPEDDRKLEQLIVKQSPDTEAREFVLMNGEFPNHEPATDRFVLEDAGQIIGYGWIGGDRADRNDCWICVDPEHRRNGYGTLLLERILARAIERHAAGLMVYLPGCEPALEFARKTGFEVKGYFRELHLPAETGRKSTTLPNGWRLEPYSKILDVERYARALDASYADLWGHGLASPDVMRQMLLTLDPQDAFLVIDASGLDVGCSGITRETPSLIDAPGLVMAHRSAQNYQAVLAAALTKLEAGSDVLLKSWGDDDGTIAAYSELGFVETKRTAMAWRAV